MSLPRSRFALALWLGSACAVYAQGIAYDFEPASGFRVGEIVGQGTAPARWSGVPKWMAVAPDAGRAGGAGLLSAVTAKAQYRGIYLPLPSGPADQGQVRFAFDFRHVEGGNTPDSPSVVSIQLGRDTKGKNTGLALRLSIRSDQSVEFVYGDTKIKNAIPPGEWVHFEGLIDYATRTVALRIGSVVCKPVPFYVEAGTGPDERGSLSFASGGSPDHRVAIDNIVLDALTDAPLSPLTSPQNAQANLRP
jgi:hypothetical protein